MEYNIRANTSERIVLSRLTKIEKSENGLVNLINEETSHAYLSIYEFIYYNFSNYSDKHSNIYIQDIAVDTGSDNDTSNDKMTFKVTYHYVHYSLTYGEYTDNLCENIYYIDSSGPDTNNIKRILLERVKEFHEKEREKNEQLYNEKMLEANNLKRIKDETFKLIDVILNNSKYETLNLSLSEFQNYVNANEGVVKGYIKSNSEQTRAITNLFSLGVFVPLFPATAFTLMQDYDKALISFAIIIVSGIIIVVTGRSVSKKVIEEATNTLETTENNPPTLTLKI